MVVNPVTNILYICGTTLGQIEAFNLDGTGRPTTPIIGSPFPTGDTGTLTLKRDPSGGYLVATNTGTTTGSLSVFRIETDGALTLMPGSPVSAGTGTFDLDVVQLSF
jgi:6-phosphogluconolactonase (cycloisomerase 2 family)